MKKSLRVLLIVFISFLLFFIAFKNFKNVMDLVQVVLHNGLLSYFVAYVLIGIPLFVAVCLINHDYKVAAHLGLRADFFGALLYALFFSLPMFIGGLVFYRFDSPVSIPNLIAGTVFAGIFEELYFRGFLFGQLFRNTKLGFLLSAIAGAVIFASQHLYQGHDPATSLGVFLVTFMGAVLFGWLYAEWNYNLWVPVFLHTFMNLSWNLFATADNALGGVYANVFRALTIAMAIVTTVFYKKRKGQKMSVNRRTLFLVKETNNNAGI